MRRFAEGKVANVIWGARFGLATGMRWVADKVHEDTRYRVSGYRMQLQEGGGVKFSESGDGLRLLYIDKEYEQFHPKNNRWADPKEVRDVAKRTSAMLTSRKWTQAQFDELVKALGL